MTRHSITTWMVPWLHARARYLMLTGGTIILGLVVHLRGDSLPPSLRDIVGDALWTAMVVWLLAAAVPTLRLPFRSGVAIAISYGVEFSQLYSSPALDALRSVTLGHLLLGSGFDSRDFVAYAVGVLAAVLVERGVVTLRAQID